ncbi:MAG TPA: hypothetical protein VGR61_04525 [Candidatus Dormibacteraeota bacterium]|nr:hypothetical protein [Candidatus Dormibacteraeota bacterium]
MIDQITARAGDDRTELAAMLLFLQAAIGVVTALGALVVSFTFASPTMGIMTLAMLVGSAFWMVLGTGLLKEWRWARRTTLVLQWVGVAGGVIGMLLQLGTGLSLVALVTNLGLPLLVIRLLRQPASSRAPNLGIQASAQGR